MLGPVLSTLTTVKATKNIRNDLVVAGNAPISSVLLGDGNHFLAELLRGSDHREEWRFLQSLDQSSPWDAFPGTTNPGVLQEVLFDSKAATGMLWAKQNDSLVLSFAFNSNWSERLIQAQLREIDQHFNITSNPVEIRNLSSLEHVAVHQNVISDYGRDLSASSLVHEGNGFAIRMYFNDHPPAHFHVLEVNSPDTLARYRIDTLDVLSGRLPSTLRGRVTEWAHRRREDLMQCWHRVRSGQHPLVLDD
jgi:hypothetical protein